MRSDIADKLDIVQVTQPVGIVDHHCLSLAEFDKTAHLLLKALTVMIDHLRRHHGSHISTSRRISDHAGSAADQCNRFISRHLQSLHQAECHEMSHMKAVCGGVEADIEYSLSVIDQLLDLLLVCQLCEKSSRLQLVKYCHRS